MSDAKPKQAATPNRTPGKINRIIDGTQVFWHDLFKSSVETMYKNIFQREDKQGNGIQLKKDIVPIEHCHIFHSHDSNGRPQSECVPVGGHFHKILTHDDQGNPFLDANGRPMVKCGPAMRKKKVRRGRKMVTVEEQVKWGMEDGKAFEDRHTHEFQYLKSKELSPDKIEQLKRQNSRQIISNFEGSPKAHGSEPLPDPKDTATITG